LLIFKNRYFNGTSNYFYGIIVAACPAQDAGVAHFNGTYTMGRLQILTMALNIATFKTRAATSGVFVAVMLLGLLWNHWSFFILISVIHFGCWIEYQKLVGLIDKNYAQVSSFHKYGVMLAGWCILLYFTNDAFTIFGIKLNAIGWWLGLIAVFALPIIELLFAKQLELKNIGYSALGLLYISLSWGLMMYLRSLPETWLTKTGHFYQMGFVIPLAIIFSIWANDTSAYLVGSLTGKTPFSKISPKKTWEGTLGGALLCIVTISLLAYWLGFNWADGAAIAAIAAVAGTSGDLLESKLKRMANVKDSGNLLPGHGGFLDRFDSLLLATPFVWLYVALFMK
jgi:phosphatidate cytidylyltransferase